MTEHGVREKLRLLQGRVRGREEWMGGKTYVETRSGRLLLDGPHEELCRQAAGLTEAWGNAVKTEGAVMGALRRAAEEIVASAGLQTRGTEASVERFVAKGMEMLLPLAERLF